jgi:hypothetical protein
MSSYSFSIEIVDEDDCSEERAKARESTVYLAIEEQHDSTFQKVIDLQQLLKSQSLLFEYCNTTATQNKNVKTNALRKFSTTT